MIACYIRLSYSHPLFNTFEGFKAHKWPELIDDTVLSNQHWTVEILLLSQVNLSKYHVVDCSKKTWKLRWGIGRICHSPGHSYGLSLRQILGATTALYPTSTNSIPPLHQQKSKFFAMNGDSPPVIHYLFLNKIWNAINRNWCIQYIEPPHSRKHNWLVAESNRN